MLGSGDEVDEVDNVRINVSREISANGFSYIGAFKPVICRRA